MMLYLEQMLWVYFPQHNACEFITLTDLTLPMNLSERPVQKTLDLNRNIIWLIYKLFLTSEVMLNSLCLISFSKLVRTLLNSEDGVGDMAKNIMHYNFFRQVPNL